MKQLFVIALLVVSAAINAQRGKDGDITINSTTIVNEYTFLTSNASAGQNSISVSNSSLNTNGRFTSSLQAGDLLFIFQAQGASLSTTGTNAGWGSITAYNNCGNYEFCEVSAVPNSTTININCSLKNSYSASGHVQVVRVPRFNSLDVNSTITCDSWNGQTGGLVVIECLGNITINASGSVNASENGFRGGIEDYAASGIGTWAYALTNTDGGGVKGESIYGYESDYTALGGKYGYGAPANGGGGGNNHNSGGGGGGNGSSIGSWIAGVGVPDPAYNAAWILETPSINGVVSSGGGKGGYTFSQNNGNPLSVGPNNYGTWAGDGRRPLGGLGGRPLDYSSGKIFFGGGGGSGDINDPETLGGHGGNSGGIIFIQSYGSINGSGDISSNGADGIDAYTTNPPNFDYAGNDGAGGGGAGGTIILNAVDGIDNNLSVTANGGNGGNQILAPGFLGPGVINEAEGPGGGGSGGFVRLSHTIASVLVNGGQNGVTNSSGVNEFPPNGATSGGPGDVEVTSALFEITAINDTICSGNSITLYASVIGSLPAGSAIIWYDAEFNGNFIGAGTSFTTGNLSNDTTFYVGICPGDYKIPVSVIMGTSFNYNTSNVLVSEENCGQSDGSITGISISGGAQPLQYEWNAVLTTNQDLLNAAAGSYTLVVTDNNGCGATIGTFNIGENLGPSIDTTGIVVSSDQCSQGVGSITGIVANGNAPFTYTWNLSPSSTIDLIGIPAGNYDLMVSDAYGCSSQIDDVEVLNSSGPNIDTTGFQIADDHCGQGIGSITGISATGISPFTYFWNGNSSSSIDTIGLISSTYELIVFDAYGCSDTISNLLVQNISGPVIDTSGLIISNESCDNLNGSISAINVIGIGPFTYFWNGLADTLDNLGLEAGLYDLLVVDSYGCQTSMLGIEVGSNDFPSAELNYFPSTIFVGDTVIFVDNTQGDIINSIFTLSDGTIVNDSIAYEYFNDRGVYDICLVVENSYGCIDSSCIEITVSPTIVDLIIPNIFTPNQDGNNDYFMIEGLNDNYSFQVFNRWGQVIFSESPYLNIWDGVGANGKALSEGTYYFLLEVLDGSIGGESYSGYIWLQR